MFKKLFLPIGMIAAVILSFISPEFGTAVKNLNGSTLLILTIFFLCGWQTDIRELRLDRHFLFVFIGGALISLIVAPWIAVGLSRLFQLEALPAVGLIVMAAVPPTLSSGVVMTENANGNTFLSMTLTIGYSLLGVFTLPLMLAWCLAGDGAIDTNPLKMFLDLVLLVVVPFFAGLFVMKFSKRNLPPWAGFIPSSCVIVLVLSFFSGSNHLLRSYPLDMLLLAGLGGLILHILLMLVMWYGGRLSGVRPKECKALIFTGASKTITLALATLAILGAADGAAVVPCLVFYFIQMMIDSALASKMALMKE